MFTVGLVIRNLFFFLLEVWHGGRRSFLWTTYGEAILTYSYEVGASSLQVFRILVNYRWCFVIIVDLGTLVLGVSVQRPWTVRYPSMHACTEKKLVIAHSSFDGQGDTEANFNLQEPTKTAKLPRQFSEGEIRRETVDGSRSRGSKGQEKGAWSTPHKMAAYSR